MSPVRGGHGPREKTDPESRSVRAGESRIHYELVRSKRRTIGILVRPNGSITVHAPKRVSIAFIESILLERHPWIKKKQAEFAEQERRKPAPLSFSPGESVPLEGEARVLDLRFSARVRPSVDMTEDHKIIVTVHEQYQDSNELPEMIKAILMHWYKIRAREVITARVDHYKAVLGVEPARIAIKDQKTRWGSCSSKGNVNFNWRLVLAPLDIQDYVVVHELCHLKVRSHSPRFWNLVRSIIPDYTDRRTWLRKNGFLLYV
ncbi:MAG TPA: SprT family zinc-dependent metalloprotease [Candidatus Lokiarchaeia archaeon]|nr:SprT family zinc-dependent metalloprotease [Candidatus Lokiarchaeia archaeon]